MVDPTPIDLDFSFLDEPTASPTIDRDPQVAVTSEIETFEIDFSFIETDEQNEQSDRSIARIFSDTIIDQGIDFAKRSANELVAGSSGGFIPEPFEVEGRDVEGGFIQGTDIKQGGSSVIAGLLATQAGAVAGQILFPIPGVGAVAGAAVGRGLFTAGQGVREGRRTFQDIKRIELEKDNDFSLYDRASAIGASIFSGSATAALEFVSIGKLGKFFGIGAKKSGKTAINEVGKAAVRRGRVKALFNSRPVKGLIIEGSTEAAQELTSQTATSLSTGGNQFDVEELARSGLVGGIVGGGVGGLASTADALLPEVEQSGEGIEQQVKKASEDVETDAAAIAEDAQRLEENQVFNEIQKASNPDNDTETVIPKEQLSSEDLQSAFQDDPDLALRTDEDGNTIVANKQRRFENAQEEREALQETLDNLPRLDKLEKRRTHKQQEINRLEKEFDTLSEQNKFEEADQVLSKVERAEGQLAKLDDKIKQGNENDSRTERGQIKNQIQLLDDEISGLETFAKEFPTGADFELEQFGAVGIPTARNLEPSELELQRDPGDTPKQLSDASSSLLGRRRTRKRDRIVAERDTAQQKIEDLTNDFDVLVNQGELRDAEIIADEIDKTRDRIDRLDTDVSNIDVRSTSPIAGAFGIAETNDGKFGVVRGGEQIGAFDTRQEALNAIRTQEPALQVVSSDVISDPQSIENGVNTFGNIPTSPQSQIIPEDVGRTVDQIVDNTNPKKSALFFRWLKRGFDPNRQLGSKNFEAFLESEGLQNRITKEAEFLMKDLNNALQNLNQFDEANLKQLNEILKANPGQTPEQRYNILSPELRPIARNMRAQLDKLSRDLVKSGAVQGPMAITVLENQGSYLNRNYKIFDLKKDWLVEMKKPENKALINQAIGLFRLRRPELRQASDVEVTTEIMGFLVDTVQGESPLGALEKSNVLRKNSNILRAREDIHPIIRQLWGERQTISENYPRSIFKMANLLASQTFLNNLKANGLASGVFSETKTTRHIAQMDVTKSKALQPISDLFVEPEFKDALEKFMSNENLLPKWIQGVVAMNSLSKMSKTVLSEQTQATNFWGNMPFLIMNGNLGSLKNFDAAFRDILHDFGIGDTIARREKILEYTEQSMLNQSTVIADLEAAAKDVLGSTDTTQDYVTRTMEATRETFKKYSVPNIGALFIGTGKLTVKGIGVAKRIYQANDDLFKILNYEAEKVKLRKEFPDITEAELRKRAAQETRDGLPFYNVAPEFVQQLRRLPLLAPFATFAAESVRITATQAQKGFQEIKNPKTRKRGFERIAFITVATSLSRATEEFSKYLTGVDDDEMNAVSDIAAPWDANSNKIITGRDKNNNLRFVSLSNSDPFFIFNKPINALFRSDLSFKDRIINTIGEVMDPFLSQEIFLDKLLDLRDNKAPNTDRPIYDLSEPVTGVQDMFAHLLTAITPTIIEQGKKAYRDIQQGRIADAVAPALFGVRPRSIDMDSIMFQKGSEFMQQRRFISADFSKAIRDAIKKDNLTESFVTQEYARANKKFQRHQGILNRKVISGLKLAIVPEEVQRQLKKASLNGELQAAALENRILNFLVSSQAMSNFEEKGADLSIIRQGIENAQ